MVENTVVADVIIYLFNKNAHSISYVFLKNFQDFSRTFHFIFSRTLPDLEINFFLFPGFPSA